MESSPPKISVEDVMRDIRGRVERRRREESAPLSLAAGPTAGGPDFSQLRGLPADVRAGAAELGRIPSSPPTVRGRLGAVLVRLVRRALFWYTPQIGDWGRTVSYALDHQFEALEAVSRIAVQAARDGELCRTDLTRLERQLAGLRDELGERIDKHVQRLSEELGSLADQLRARSEESAAVVRLSDDVARLADQLCTLSRHAAALDGQIGAVPVAVELQRIRAELASQERRILVLLHEARTRLPAAFDQQQLNVLADEGSHCYEAFYATFEDRFRGSREDIKDRVKVYLPYLRQAAPGISGKRVVDLGCGRGEWLELLRDEGFAAVGADRNRTMVERCRALGLEVSEAGAVEYLRSLPEASLGAVTSFHVLEHLPWGEVLELIDEAVRVLARGGICIFETPNPQNLLVASFSFHLDPTHRAPLPAPLLQFMMEARGLSNPQVLMLHPDAEAQALPEENGWGGFLKERFYGPRDYAVIASKL